MRDYKARIALAAGLAVSAWMTPVRAAGPTTAPAPVAATPQSMSDLQAMIDAKQYADAVKAAGKMLALRGPAAAGISRFQVTMLKGEAQAGNKQFSAAVDTFKSAIKESEDPREQALAKWTGELFKKSSGGTYIPKAVGPGGARPPTINLLDLSTRPAAFAALFDDELAALTPKIKTATSSTLLNAIFPVIDQVVALGKLDKIANGNDDATAKASKGLLDHSRSLLVNAVKSMWSRISDIEKTANQTTQTTQNQVINGVMAANTITHKNGLTASNKVELQNMIDTCTKVKDAAQMFAASADSDKDWSAVQNDADRVAAKAQDLLNTDFSDQTSTNGSNNGWTDNGNGTVTDASGNTYRRDNNGNWVSVGGINSTGIGNNFPTGGGGTGPARGGNGSGNGGTGNGGSTGTGTTPTPTPTPAKPVPPKTVKPNQPNQQGNNN